MRIQEIAREIERYNEEINRTMSEKRKWQLNQHIRKLRKQLRIELQIKKYGGVK